MPLVFDGRPRSLRGVLDYSSPGAVWAWIAAPVILALAAAFAATRSAATLAGLALTATAAVWAIRIGRELFTGRPAVPVVGWIEIAITSLVGALFVFGLTRRDAGTRAFTAFFVGFGALYEGLTMLPIVTHAIAPDALPSLLARIHEGIIVVAGMYRCAQRQRLPAAARSAPRTQRGGKG